MSETNYERYFGTPEKAADFMESVCNVIDGHEACGHCPVWGINIRCYGSREQMLEWLESEAE